MNKPVFEMLSPWRATYNILLMFLFALFFGLLLDSKEYVFVAMAPPVVSWATFLFFGKHVMAGRWVYFCFWPFIRAEIDLDGIHESDSVR